GRGAQKRRLPFPAACPLAIAHPNRVARAKQGNSSARPKKKAGVSPNDLQSPGSCRLDLSCRRAPCRAALPPERPHFGRPALQLEVIAVRERLGELLLVGYEQDATQMIAQILQLLDHHLPPLLVQAAEPLVDDDRLDRPVLPAGVLA